jgi:hypothetical protein
MGPSESYSRSSQAMVKFNGEIQASSHSQIHLSRRDRAQPRYHPSWDRETQFAQ